MARNYEGSHGYVGDGEWTLLGKSYFNQASYVTACHEHGITPHLNYDIYGVLRDAGKRRQHAITASVVDDGRDRENTDERGLEVIQPPDNIGLGPRGHKRIGRKERDEVIQHLNKLLVEEVIGKDVHDARVAAADKAAVPEQLAVLLADIGPLPLSDEQEEAQIKARRAEDEAIAKHDKEKANREKELKAIVRKRKVRFEKLIAQATGGLVLMALALASIGSPGQFAALLTKQLPLQFIFIPAFILGVSMLAPAAFFLAKFPKTLGDIIREHYEVHPPEGKS